MPVREAGPSCVHAYEDLLPPALNAHTGTYVLEVREVGVYRSPDLPLIIGQDS